MEDSKKKCVACGDFFSKKSSVSLKSWEKSKFCSRPCVLASIGFKLGHSTWNKGKTGYISDKGKEKLVENARRNIAKETENQRSERIRKTIESRNRNGVWVPPRLGKFGYDCPIFLGDKATYNAKHRWIQKHWIKTGECEECGAVPKPYGRRKHGTEWHNLDGNYNRDDRATWKEVCVRCHRRLEKR